MSIEIKTATLEPIRQQERSEACAGKSASNDLERLGRKERTGQPACESKAVIWVLLLITLRFL